MGRHHEKAGRYPLHSRFEDVDQWQSRRHDVGIAVRPQERSNTLVCDEAAVPGPTEECDFSRMYEHRGIDPAVLPVREASRRGSPAEQLRDRVRCPLIVSFGPDRDIVICGQDVVDDGGA